MEKAQQWRRWIKEENVNTKYFHKTIKWRRLNNGEGSTITLQG